MSTEDNSCPWKSGTWYNEKVTFQLSLVDGKNMKNVSLMWLDFPDCKAVKTGTWKKGDFGPARNEIAEKTGIQNYNIQMDSIFGKIPGVLHENGTQIDYWGFSNGYEVIKWMTPEELEKIKENREPAEAPSISYYSPQPDNPGKLIWLSGPPGAGKSTSGMLLGRKHGYVYYEADCFGMFVNPYVDPNVEEPTLAIMQQKALKGVTKETMDAMGVATETFDKIHETMEVTEEMIDSMEPMFRCMAKDIVAQRKRLGGNMAIAQAVINKKQRDNLRSWIGPDLVFIVLSLSKECQKKRVMARHGESIPEEFMTILTKFAELYEPAEAGEENAFNVIIDENDTRETVLEKILELIK